MYWNPSRHTSVRIAPVNTPLAALETLAMQVVVNAQPVFDARVARGWVKSFEVTEETSEAESTEGADGKAPEETKPKKGKKVEKVTTPSSGLLGKMTASGLLVAYPNNKMRFTHPVFAGYLAGRALVNYNVEVDYPQPAGLVGQISCHALLRRARRCQQAGTSPAGIFAPAHAPSAFCGSPLVA